MDIQKWTTFRHPHGAYTLEFPEQWEHRVEKDGADCGFGPRDRENVGLWISITPARLDTDRLADELPVMFEQAMGRAEATNLRRDESLHHHGMKADMAKRGEGGNFWLLAGGDLVLFASSQVPVDERGTWNPLFDRLMGSLRITREDELLEIKVAGEVLRQLRERAPQEDYKLEDGNIRGKSHQVFVHNIMRGVKEAPERMEEIIEQFVVGILSSEQQQMGHEVWAEVRADVLPVLKPIGYVQQEGPTQHLTYSDWLGEVVICYVVHGKKTLRFLTRWDLDRWGLDLEKLHDEAIKNLAALPWPETLRSAHEPGMGRTMVIHTGDSFDASRLLHPELHQLFSKPLGSPFLAAVPDRDTCVAFTDEPALRERIAKVVRHDHDNSAYPISRRLFLVTADGVALA